MPYVNWDGGGKMTLWVKVPITKPVDLSSVPGVHMVEEELLKVVLSYSDSWKLPSDLHVYCGILVHVYTHAHT